MKKRLAVFAAVLLGSQRAPQAAWAFGEPYDAPTLSMGGTYVARYDDINSPFFNPADLRHVRGTVYIGPGLGALLATDAGTYQDILGAMATQPTGEFGSLMTYINNAEAYNKQVTAALGSGTAIQDPPAVGNITIPSYLNIFAKVDSGIAGVNIPFGDGYAAGWRSYLSVGATPFIAAPQAAGMVSSVLQGDHDLAMALLTLRSDASQGDLAGVYSEVTSVKSLLNTTLGPMATPQGLSFTLGAEADAYLANAFSFEMPLPVFRRPLGGLQSGDSTLGFTLKVFSGGGAFGLNQAMQQAIDNATAGSGFLPSGFATGVPGRIDLTSNINLQKPLNDLYAALDGFASNPASDSAQLTTAAAEIPGGYSLDLVSHTAGAMGVGLDIGSIFPLQHGFRIGAILQNFPQTFWPGQKTAYKGTISASASSSASTSNPLSGYGFNWSAGQSSYENYTYSEPTAVRLGGGWQGPLGLSAAADLGESFDNPNNPLWADTPTLNLGLQESIFNILYLRVGGQIGGLDSLVGGGVGLNVGIARVDLGVAGAPGLNDFNAAASVNLGV